MKRKQTCVPGEIIEHVQINDLRLNSHNLLKCTRIVFFFIEWQKK